MPDQNETRPSVLDRLAALPWALMVVLAGGGIALVWFLRAPPPPPASRAAPSAPGAPVVDPALAGPDPIKAQGFQLTHEASSALGDIRAILTKVTDAETAENAVPQIVEQLARLAELKARFEKLPAEQQKLVTMSVVQGRKNLYLRVDKILALPGVSEILSENVERLKAELDAFGT